MQYISSPKLNIPVSVLGFGCSALLGRASQKESETAVAAALDAGVNFFDTARSYGYGQSEGLLGKLLAGRRDKVVLCTKFGILPPQRSLKTILLPVARKAVKLFPALRGAAKAQAQTQFTPGQFSAAVLEQSIHASLRELKTDYVDMLLLHEATADALKDETLLKALEKLVQAGKVRMAGFSARHELIAAFLAAPTTPLLTTLQFAMNVNTLGFTKQTAAHPERLMVANHPFGGPGGVDATREKIASLATSSHIPDEARRKLVDGAGDNQLLPEILLNLLLAGTGVSAVIPAMMRPQNIASNTRAISKCRFTADEFNGYARGFDASLAAR